MAELDPPFERLVPGGEAIELLAREHDRRGIHSKWSACLDAAHETILSRLLAGHLVAYAETCEIDCDNPAPPAPGEVVREEDFFRGSTVCKIPLAFWCHYHNAGSRWRKFDLVSSDFSFRFSDGEWDSYRWREGGAYSVWFDRNGLPTAAVPTYSPALNNPVSPDKPPTIERNKGGAPAKYDWERAVVAIVFQWADEGSWQPASKTEVKNKLADWFAAQSRHPSDSLLKERAGWLFEEFQRRNGEADNLAA